MKLQIEIAGQLRTVELERGETPDVYRATLHAAPLGREAGPTALGGKLVTIEARLLRPGVLSLVVDGQAHRVVLEDHAEEPAVHLAGRRYVYRLDDPRSLKARRAHAKGSDGPKQIEASMPGRVVRVLAARGETVEANQGVVVIEAMKMQNELKAPKAGVVAEVRVAAGDTVAAGDVLAVVE